MLLERSFPLNSTVLNCQHHLAKVVGYRANELVVEGIGAYHNVGQWLASPEMTTRLSDGHFGISGKWEYFIVGKSLYRAPMTNPIDREGGYRLGAREVMPLHLVDSEMLRGLGL